MRILKTILNIILSFLLIIVIAMSFAINILGNKILNKNYFSSKLEETEFYLQVSREVENGFENYIYQSGLPEDTIKNLFTEEDIKKDVNSIVNKLYDGTDITLSSENVKENLDNKINEYLEKEDMKMNNQGKENIKKFEDLIVKEYTKNVNASNTLYSKGHEGIETLNRIYNKVGNIPIIAIIILLVLLILINIKDLLNGINYVGISLLSLGVLIKLAINLINSNINIDDLLVLTTSISNLIINIINDILFELSEKSNICIVAGITAIIITAILKNINFKKKEK